MKIIDLVLTINQAAEAYDVDRSTLRKAIVNEFKGFEHGVNCQKTAGEKSPWLVTREAVEEAYGEKTN